MRAIWVVGCSGAGKTTTARRLAARLGLLHLELDSVFHQAGWTPLPEAEFRERVAAVLDAAQGWVVCGNYQGALGDTVLRRADTIVWLDPPRGRLMRRLLLRTLRRTLTGELLWNGNRERPGSLLRWDPEESILRWAWVQFPTYRARYEAASTDGTWAHARVLRLRSDAEVDSFVDAAGP